MGISVFLQEDNTSPPCSKVPFVTPPAIPAVTPIVKPTTTVSGIRVTPQQKHKASFKFFLEKHRGLQLVAEQQRVVSSAKTPHAMKI